MTWGSRLLAGGSPKGSSADWREKFTPARWAALALVALSIVLIAENTQQVRIRLLVPVVTMPLYAALLIMFALGGLCGVLVLRSRSHRA